MILQKQNSGFALIALLLAVAIIAVLFVMYYGGSGNGKSVQQTGKNAIEQTKQNNALEIQNHIEIQNGLNSVDR